MLKCKKNQIFTLYSIKLKNFRLFSQTPMYGEKVIGFKIFFYNRVACVAYVMLIHAPLNNRTCVLLCAQDRPSHQLPHYYDYDAFCYFHQKRCSRVLDSATARVVTIFMIQKFLYFWLNEFFCEGLADKKI